MAWYWRRDDNEAYLKKTIEKRESLGKRLGLRAACFLLVPLLTLFTFFAVILALINQMIPKKEMSKQERPSLHQVHDCS